MRVTGIVATTAMAVLLGAGVAAAQDEPTVGLTMGYPASVGVLWHVTDRVALRPDVTWNRNTTESTLATGVGSSQTTLDGRSLGLGLSVLLTVGEWEDVRAYVSPRFDYARTTSTIALALTASESDASVYGAGLAFGVQYTPARRFGVYGEAGLGYTRSTNEVSTSGLSIAPTTTSTGLGLRSGAGVVFYF